MNGKKSTTKARIKLSKARIKLSKAWIKLSKARSELFGTETLKKRLSSL